MAESNDYLDSNVTTEDIVNGISKITLQHLSDQPKLLYEMPSEIATFNAFDITIDCLLGKGSYGVVMKAKWNWNKKDVAAKIIKTRDANAINREVLMMSQLRHPNIIELFGYGKMSNGDHFIVMELMENGSLDTVLHSENSAAIMQYKCDSWSIQIAEGLSHIHRNDHIHRDLKPSNILLANNYQIVKIGDFGTARDGHTPPMTILVGTSVYMAPEVFDNQNYTYECDVYSLGITLCEMYTKRRPYADMQREGLKARIRNGLRPLLNEDKIDEDVRAIINRCCEADSQLRPSMDEIIQFTKKRRLMSIKAVIAKMTVDELMQFAEYEAKHKHERVKALIQLAKSLGNTINATQLDFISKIIDRTNSEIDALSSVPVITTEITQLYENRLQLINAIAIDCEIWTDEFWFHYARLLEVAFIRQSSKFFDNESICAFECNNRQQIHHYINRLIVEKMRLFLSTPVIWNSVGWLPYYDSNCIEIISKFTQLIVAFRIETTNIDDTQLLKLRLDQFHRYATTSRSICASTHYWLIDDVAERIGAIERLQHSNCR